MGRDSFATVLVGQRDMLREGLTRILGAADFRIAAAESSVEEISPTAFPDGQAVLLVVDVSRDHGDTVRQIELFKVRCPTARIALLADHDQPDDSDIVEAFRAGAHAYFAKPTCETFIKSLELVMLGETILPPQLVSFMLDHHIESVAPRLGRSGETSKEVESKFTPRLSAREICILRCLIDGNSNKMIARSNSITESTVKVHVKAILRKIRVTNRTQAAIWGMNNDSSMRSRSDAATSSATEPSIRRSAVLTRSEALVLGAAPPLGLSQQVPKMNGGDHGNWPDSDIQAGTDVKH